jgi:type IV pilus assembly protein PilA
VRGVRQRLLVSQDGFTLAEVLVVILVIGALAAIALGAFLGQSAKAQDAEARSNARNMVSLLDTCFVDADSYIGCPTGATGLPVGAGRGQVEVTSQTANTYGVVARSESGEDFALTRNADRTLTRSPNW